MNRSRVDLHLHSSASDGRLTPAELVRHVAACGVELMALTDHDTTAGIAAAAREAAAIGMAFVAGVELSADWRGRSIHVLGLAIDPAGTELAAGIARVQSQRRERAVEIARRLDAAGAPGTEVLERVTRETPLPTRTHFARALAELGAARTVAEAFERYLGRGAPASVRTEWPAMGEAVGWINAAGGVAVLAHPLRYTLSAGQRRDLATEFRALGGAGVELACGGASTAQLHQAVSLATRSGLDGSVGSDFHDPAVPWNPPGRLAKLPASVRPVWARPAFPEGFVEVCP